MRNLLLICLLFTVGGSVRAQEHAGWTKCVSCWKQFPDHTLYQAKAPGFLEPQPICKECTQLKERCFECSLPIKNRGKKLGDGRFICGQHAPNAVQTLQEGLALMKEVERDLMRMLSGLGSLPQDNIQLELVDAKEMARLLRGGQLLHPAKSAVGLSQATVHRDGKLTHKVWILNGLSPTRFSAVAAHEYTHCWVAENVNRTIEAATVEGFCELLALKVMEARNNQAEQEVILSNAYTQGRIHSLQRAAKSYQTHRIVDWVKNGEDLAVSEAEPERVLTLTRSEPALYQLGQPIRTAVPDTLTLKGISGTPGRRFALVNDRTFERNELGRVRVGETNVMVRCLEISERSVLVQVVESGERRELFLAAPTFPPRSLRPPVLTGER